MSTTVADDSLEETAPVIHERSWLFGLMIAPTGALANGLVQGGALAYLLSTQGIVSGGQSHLIALLGIPTWLYFVWSPITDFFVKRRTWFAAVPWLLRRMRLRVRAIVLAVSICLVNSLALAILWLGHLDPRTYFIGVTLYLFTEAISCAAFTAVILEFMGDAGTSGSTRYSLINALGNVSVQYMILVDGWGCDHFGVRGLAGMECVVGIVATVALLSWLLVKRPTLPADASVMCLPFSRA